MRKNSLTKKDWLVVVLFVATVVSLLVLLVASEPSAQLSLLVFGGMLAAGAFAHETTRPDPFFVVAPVQRKLEPARTVHQLPAPAVVEPSADFCRLLEHTVMLGKMPPLAMSVDELLADVPETQEERDFRQLCKITQSTVA